VQADVAAHGATHAGLRQSIDPPCPGPTGDTAKTQASFVPKTSVAHGKQAACGRPASHPAASAPAWHPQRVASPGCCRPSNVTIRRARRPHKPRVTLTCSHSPLREGLANTVPRGYPAGHARCGHRRLHVRAADDSCAAELALASVDYTSRARTRARARYSHEPRAAIHQTSALC